MALNGQNTSDPRKYNGVIMGPANGDQVKTPEVSDVLEGWTGENAGDTVAENFYLEAKRRYEAKQRLQRELSEQKISLTLSPHQQARMDSIDANVMDRDALSRLPRPTALIDGLLFMDSLSWIAGPSGSYKSFVALDIAARFASDDMDYHGLEIPYHGKALIIVGEGNSSYIDRVEAWEEWNGRPWPDDARFHNGPIQYGDPDSVAAMARYARDKGFNLVIFDTQAMCTVGMDENTALDMGVMVNAMSNMREATGGCIMNVHHFTKEGGSMRGSGAMYAAATTIIVTERKGHELKLTTKNEDQGKQKDAPERDDLLFKVEKCRASLAVTTPVKLRPYGIDGPSVPLVVVTLNTRERIMLRYLEGVQVSAPTGVGPSMLAQHLNEENETTDSGTPVKSNNVVSWLNRLKREELVDGSRTSYRITAKGLDALNPRVTQEGWSE